jgi:hypothetical protein
MTMSQHHLIRRELVDVAVAGTEAEGFAVQRRIADLCRDWLGPALDAALGRVVPPDEHWTFDRLEIDAGALGIDMLDRDFVRLVSEAVASQIRDRAAGRGGAVSQRMPAAAGEGDPRATAARGDAASPDAIQRRTDAQAVQDAFLHVLATGVLPWWYRPAPGQTLETALLESWPPASVPASFATVLLRAASESSTARTRLVRQSSPIFLARLLRNVMPPTVLDLQSAALARIADARLSPTRAQLFVEALWHAVFGAATGSALATAWHREAPSPQGELETALIAHVTDILSSHALRLTPRQDSRTTRPDRESVGPNGTALPAHADAGPSTPDRAQRQRPRRVPPQDRIDLDEGVFVECAGIVLLHPFLPRLFEALEIARDGALVAPDRALALLHFLATGERQAPEYVLVLPKLLCGLPLDAPCGAPHPVSDAEAEEGTALLQAVIGHWEALGATSVDALRGTFLVRPGKLGRRGDDAVLQAEERAFDILLEHLPWGISPVQLPWMKAMLWVEWRM